MLRQLFCIDSPDIYTFFDVVLGPRIHCSLLPLFAENTQYSKALNLVVLQDFSLAIKQLLSAGSPDLYLIAKPF